MRKKENYSISIFQWITPVLIMVFYIYMFIESWNLKSFSNDYIGSDFLPKLITGLGFFCTLKIFIDQVAITTKERRKLRDSARISD